MSTRPDEVWWGRPLAETRWTAELARLLVDPVFHGAGVPRGDGRPVVLTPGLGGGDQTLAPLALWLRRIGYRPYTLGFVTNTGCSDRALERLERKVLALRARDDRRIALVGHSRGGHYSRALAARRPDAISHAISIGADLNTMLGVSRPTTYAVAAARRAVRASGRAREAGCLTAACTCGFARDFAAPFPADRVRLMSIYSKGDGVVAWRGSVVPEAECVEVTGSHVGLVFNRKVYRAVAAALALGEL